MRERAPYSEAHFRRMETDPELRRQYFWERGHYLLLEAVELRRLGRREEAGHIGRTGRFLLENLELMTRISGTEKT